MIRETVVIIEAYCFCQLYNIVSAILLSNLTPHAEKIFGNHWCGFRRKRSITDLIICIRQILDRKLEYAEALRRLFIDFKAVYNSVRRQVLYNTLIEFGTTV